MFCVQCGKDCEKQINGLCVKCFLHGRKLINFPHHTDLFRCTNCEEYLFGDRWLKMDELEAVENTAFSSMSIIPEGKLVSYGLLATPQDDRTYVVSVEADISVFDEVVEMDTGQTIIRLKNNVCKKCSRQLGNYYEATLQLRSSEKDLNEKLRDEIVRLIRDTVETQAKNNRSLFITKVQEVHGGVDILLSSISLAKSLTKMLVDDYGAESKESASLVGMTSDGQDMYRLTYLVRIPAYYHDVILEYKGKPHILTKINKTGGKIKNLESFQEYSVRKSELQDMKVLAKPEDFVDAIVVSSNDDEIQIMHPSNYSTIDVKIPKDCMVGESVTVVLLDDVLYFIR